ncbi:MAG: flagellar motor protein MotB [Methylotenera sp.]
MVRRPLEDDEDNPERWLVSYADFITLLFAFFVVMYSVSSVNQSKYMKVSSSINTAFSKTKANEDNSNSPTQTQQKELNTTVQPPSSADKLEQVNSADLASMTTLGKKLSKTLAPWIKAGNARIIQNSRGLRIDIKDIALFTAGSADLTEPAKVMLKDVAAPLTINSHDVLIEGHTDNTPIHIQNAAFFSSWELSAVRASSITSLLNEAGIDKIRLSALGYGPSQPVADNMTEAGREINRHITIIVLYQPLNSASNDGVEIMPDAN